MAPDDRRFQIAIALIVGVIVIVALLGAVGQLGYPR
jgi:hypothetical protein